MNDLFIQQWSEPKPLKLHLEPASSQKTVRIPSYHNLEVVAGNDHLSVLHPADGGLRVSRHGTLHFDVRAFIRVHVRRVVEKLRRHWGQREKNMINIVWTTTETTSQTRTNHIHSNQIRPERMEDHKRFIQSNINKNRIKLYRNQLWFEPFTECMMLPM